MEDKSIFEDKAHRPTEEDLAERLGKTYTLWVTIRQMVLDKYPTGIESWNYPGAKFGWSYRINDKKRAILYLLPRDRFFKVAFVFGDKAVDELLQSPVSKDTLQQLADAPRYAEGRGIRIDIRKKGDIRDIAALVDAKLKTR